MNKVYVTTSSFATFSNEPLGLLDKNGISFKLNDRGRKITPDDELLKIEEEIPLKRIANPKEIANVVAFLCSNKSSYIHGAVIDINGGQL